MSSVAAARAIGHPLDDSAGIARAFDELMANRTAAPSLLALGEPTHGIGAFPVLRNELLVHLVERGFRSVVLETDLFAASLVDDHVNGGPSDLDTALATGFSHGFGSVPANRELLQWLRAHNADRAPHDRVHFYGFDAPVEFSGAPSPRRALEAVIDQLPVGLRPQSLVDLGSLVDLDALLGEDADWSNPAAMYDPAASLGSSDRVRALRVVADDLAGAVRRAAPVLHETGYALALAHARTAQGLLRYHAAMAGTGSDRIGTLLSLRAEMMAENLVAIVAQEQSRGPSLVFAHNAHLQRAPSRMTVGGDVVSWGSAGALVGFELGERYLFVATDAQPDRDAGSLQGLLAAATDRRALFPSSALRALIPSSMSAGEPIVPGHIPLLPADLDGTDAVIFIADTDGIRHQYW